MGDTNGVRDAQASEETWARRNRGWIVGVGYAGFGALLAVLGLAGDAPRALSILAFLSEPVASIALDGLGAWPAVILGLCVNAAALGYVFHAVGRFASRMEGMADLTVRVLGRDRR